MRPKNSSNSKNPRKRRSQDDPSSDNESESHVNRRKKLNKVKPSRDDSGSSVPSTSSNGHRGQPAQNSRKPIPNGNSVPPNPQSSSTTTASTFANRQPPQNTPRPPPKPWHEQLTTHQKLAAFNAIPLSGKKTLDEAFIWQMEKLDEFFHEKQLRSDEEAKEIGKSLAMSDELVKDLLRELRENTLTDFIRGKRASLPGQLEALMSEYQKNNIWTQKVCKEVKEKLGLEMKQVMEFLTMVRSIKPVVHLTSNGRKLLQEQLEDWKRDGKLSALVMFELEEKTKLSRPEIEDWFKQKTGGAKKEEKPTPDPSLGDRENGVESGEEQVVDSGEEKVEQKVDNGNGQDLELDDEQEPPTIHQNYRNQEFDESYEHHDDRAQLMEAEEYGSRDQQMEPKLDQDLPIQEPGPVEVIILDDSDEEDDEEARAVNGQEEVEDVPNFLHQWYLANPDPTFSQIQEVAQRCKSNGLEVFLFLQTQQNQGFNFRG